MLTIKQGDSLLLMQELDNRTVDMVLTDPPYCNGGVNVANKRTPTSKKIQQSTTKDLKPDFLGDTRDQRSFQKWLQLWMSEAYRVCKDNAVMACFIDWRNLACVIDAVQVAGFSYRGVFCWVKPNGRPQRNAFKNDVEFIVWATKGAIQPGEDGDLYCPGHIIQQPMATSKRIHGTEKPVPVLEQLMTFVPKGGTVLDPFCGSGATGEACHNKGLNFVGFELSEEYARLAQERLDKLEAAGLVEKMPDGRWKTKEQ